MIRRLPVPLCLPQEVEALDLLAYDQYLRDPEKVRGHWVRG